MSQNSSLANVVCFIKCNVNLNSDPASINGLVTDEKQSYVVEDVILMLFKIR